ncbi:uncharacterized protein LOC115446100 [Manduca sexta]|uniref:Uncharacterized protein n=1 Tax=Manduca sexta TaxID=7130 RepID=A0A921ZB64_MANSE|nr:uncharacterized protein LOC115446100 [Manduca sexta]KAG6454196.1 hypothetical protein O3G_MSEX008556 [Manduca sexta]KAG6454197.1 hypothetical protein O3G_MSEX008556 [Manduca sexta]
MYNLGLCVLVAVVTVVAANDLTVGSQGGKKIHDENLQASPAIWRQDKNVTFNATEGHLISRVIITDLRPQKDGEAKIVDGGEGHKNVTIELKSPAVFRGFEFNVQVYATPDNNQQSVSVQQQTSTQTPQVPTQEPKEPIPAIGDASDNKQQSVSLDQQTTQQTPQVPTQEPKLPIFVSNASDDIQQTASDQQQTQDPKEDKLRKTRKTEEKDKQNVSPQVFVSEPTPAPTQVQKENDQKINIPVNLGKEVTSTTKPAEPAQKKEEVTTSTPKSAEPGLKEESDVVDPVVIHMQPTHLNSTEKVAPTAATQQQAPKEGSLDLQFRDFRQAESTTEGVTSTTSADNEKTTIINGIIYGFSIPRDAPSEYPPQVNVQGLNNAKTSAAKNGPVMTQEKAPLPYKH